MQVRLCTPEGVHVDPHQPLGVLLLANRDFVVVVLSHVKAQVGELTFFLGPIVEPLLQERLDVALEPLGAAH